MRSSCKKTDDKPWIVKKDRQSLNSQKRSSLAVSDKLNETRIEVLRDKRLASIDSQAALAELVEGDKDLAQVQTKVINESSQL